MELARRRELEEAPRGWRHGAGVRGKGGSSGVEAEGARARESLSESVGFIGLHFLFFGLSVGFRRRSRKVGTQCDRGAESLASMESAAHPVYQSLAAQCLIRRPNRPSSFATSESKTKEVQGGNERRMESRGEGI